MGGGGEAWPRHGSSVSASTKRQEWVKIGAWEYDVARFKHPGGSILRYMLASSGADATEAFREFHGRSRKANNILQALPKRPASYLSRDRVPDEQMLEAFSKWRESLEAEGFFAPRPLHVASRILELLALLALGLGLYRLRHPLPATLVMGLFGARCGWVQHEGGHSSLTGATALDKCIQKATAGFGLGCSGAMWNHMHNKHHATPQKEGHDMDLDTTPLVAFFDRAVETNRPRPHSRLWLRFQAWTFLPVTSGLFVMAFWILFLHPRQVGKARDGAQALWMLAFHVVRPLLVARAAGCSFFQGYAFTWASIWLSGMYLFGHFATSHTHLDVVPGDEHRNWVRYAVDHTVDISPDNPLVNWAMGYLNCQVIHHLFPQMPQCVQPEVSRRFRKFAREWGLKYHIIGYGEAWHKTFANLVAVGEAYYEKGRSGQDPGPAPFSMGSVHAG